MMRATVINISLAKHSLVFIISYSFASAMAVSSELVTINQERMEKRANDFSRKEIFIFIIERTLLDKN